MLKFPAVPAESNEIAAPPLVRVTVCAAPVLPTFCEAKVSVVGLRATLGTVVGVMGNEAAEVALRPAELLAVTVQVVGVPLLNPPTRIGEPLPELLLGAQLAV